jgi:hypothetical protein
LGASTGPPIQAGRPPPALLFEAVATFWALIGGRTCRLLFGLPMEELLLRMGPLDGPELLRGASCCGCCCERVEVGSGREFDEGREVLGGNEVEDARDGRETLWPDSLKSLERAASMLSRSCLTVLRADVWQPLLVVR